MDARNHGDSPHENEHTYYHLAEDINFFMKNQKIDKVALIGHSMGGRAVMAFTLLYVCLKYYIILYFILVLVK